LEQKKVRHHGQIDVTGKNAQQKEGNTSRQKRQMKMIKINSILQLRNKQKIL